MRTARLKAIPLTAAIFFGGCISIDSINVTHDQPTNRVRVEALIDTGASRVFDVEASATLEFKPVETFPPRTATIALAPSGVTVRGEQLFSGEIASPYAAASCLSEVDVTVNVRGRSGTGNRRKTARVSQDLGGGSLLWAAICPDCMGPFVSSGIANPVRVGLNCPREEETSVTFKGEGNTDLQLVFVPNRQSLLLGAREVSIDGEDVTINYSLRLAKDPLPVQMIAITEIDGQEYCSFAKVCVIPVGAETPGSDNPAYGNCERDREVSSEPIVDCSLLGSLLNDEMD